MKALLLCGSLIFAGAIFISAGKSNPNDLSRDQKFIKSIEYVSALASDFNKLNEAELNQRVDRLLNSIDELKTRYPELANAATTTTAVYAAFDKSARNGSIHGDSCFKALIREVFNCLSNCGGPRETVRTCLATACANYQACKAGENR
jgi:hypothetical protein